MSQNNHQQQNILRLLRKVYQSIQKHSHHVESVCGVSASQLWALGELQDSPGQRVTELASKLGIHKSTASNMLDKLELKECIRRERRSEDQRSVFVFLTPKGQQVLDSTSLPPKGVVMSALHKCSEQERNDLVTALQTLVKRIEADLAAYKLKPSVQDAETLSAIVKNA